MKFLTAAGSTLLLANVVLASPLTRRAVAAGKVVKSPGLNRNVTIPGFADQESSNWGGAVIVSSDVTEVTGTFTIPQPQVPSGGDPSTQYCGAAWVGIDGDTCQSGLIQTGVFWCVQNGEYSYEAWYEFIPAASIAYSDISVNVGDSITVTVTADGANGGVTTFTDNTTGQTVSHTFTDDTDGTLCGTNAEWIVEDFEQGSSLVPFADFGTVTFTGATAVVGGSTVFPGDEGATNIYIELNNQQLTSASIDGDQVTVSYV
ncbi:Aspergillopepsin-2 [Lachnellula suecica]|uniref:Aspergillopepsin-2 n=1 Tax=Lachnellula suecica TaxID=602035 RepID=A0A8T9C7L9_9HELO|nr:Aspergillopepsin-2 [Lachnellula suecica]